MRVFSEFFDKKHNKNRNFRDKTLKKHEISGSKNTPILGRFSKNSVRAPKSCGRLGHLGPKKGPKTDLLRAPPEENDRFWHFPLKKEW